MRRNEENIERMWMLSDIEKDYEINEMRTVAAGYAYAAELGTLYIYYDETPYFGRYKLSKGSPFLIGRRNWWCELNYNL